MAASLQLVLGIHRARLTGSSLRPALALTALIAAVGVLWLVRFRRVRGAALARPAALLFATIGAVSAQSALNAPMIGALARTATPLFALSAAAVLVAAEYPSQIRLWTVVLFAVSVIILQIALTADARWQQTGGSLPRLRLMQND